MKSEKTTLANVKNQTKETEKRYCKGCSLKKKEFCCRACGNTAYPDCKLSCPLFDD